ncbi:MAG: ABC transporter ATP-binding protein [Gemmatimonadaceae bacterium]|nr:ABC transporter ATP-binding protein [Gemmatimonadaceae bacterium]
MTMVTVDGLTKRFARPRGWLETLRAPFDSPQVVAVDAVSFSVTAGEVFGLLGQNGAGKTTLFKMLTTLLLPDAGRATVAGHDVRTAGGAVRRLVAPVIANERSLYWRLPARENLRLFAALQGLGGAAAAAEVERVLAITGIADTGAKMVSLFSSGMRQRLLIARALLGRPRVLLLDEPTRSLDPISARDFRRFLRETVVAGEGCTVLLATHDADEVWDLCDRVGVLERGRLLAVEATARLRHRSGGDRHRLWLRPADAAAAAAIGALRLEARGATVEPGWEAYECVIPGGAEGAAQALARLSGAGIAVARFERTDPSLADLIERTLRADAGGHDA